jgi:hypothetical protein
MLNEKNFDNDILSSIKESILLNSMIDWDDCSDDISTLCPDGYANAWLPCGPKFELHIKDSWDCNVIPADIDRKIYAEPMEGCENEFECVVYKCDDMQYCDMSYFAGKQIGVHEIITETFNAKDIYSDLELETLGHTDLLDCDWTGLDRSTEFCMADGCCEMSYLNCYGYADCTDVMCTVYGGCTAVDVDIYRERLECSTPMLDVEMGSDIEHIICSQPFTCGSRLEFPGNPEIDCGINRLSCYTEDDMVDCNGQYGNFYPFDEIECREPRYRCDKPMSDYYTDRDKVWLDIRAVIPCYISEADVALCKCYQQFEDYYNEKDSISYIDEDGVFIVENDSYIIETIQN